MPDMLDGLMSQLGMLSEGDGGGGGGGGGGGFLAKLKSFFK
jgi:hypothetical protein